MVCTHRSLNRTPSHAARVGRTGRKKSSLSLSLSRKRRKFSKNVGKSQFPVLGGKFTDKDDRITEMAFPLSKRLQRIGAEIRFQPNLTSARNVMDAARLMEEKYQNWNLLKGRHHDIVLSSKDEKKALRIKSNSMIYSNETHYTTTELLNHFQKIYQKLVVEPRVEEVVHIGFRNIAIFESNLTYLELIGIVFEKFFRQDGPIKEVACDRPLDTGFTLDAEKSGVKNHIRIFPMKKEEALSTFNSNFGMDESIFQTDTCLLFDVDTFLSEGHSSTALKKLEEVIASNNTISNSLKEYITA